MSIQAKTLLEIYRAGFFPMADGRDDTDIRILAPQERALLPIRDLRLSRRLGRSLRQAIFEVRVDTDIPAVIAACAAARADTWINDVIYQAHCDLAAQGHVHSVEVWQAGQLVGGLYGVAIGGLFCGESMFSHVRDASKIALVHLCARLWHQGFQVLDAQFDNPHLHQFGQYLMPHDDYVRMIGPVCALPVCFSSDVPQVDMLRAYLQLAKPETQE